MNISRSDITFQADNSRSTTGQLHRHYYRMRKGLITPFEYVLLCVDRGMEKFMGHSPNIAIPSIVRRVIKDLQKSGNVEHDYYKFKDAKIPTLDAEKSQLFFYFVFHDTFYCYLYLDDNYREADINEYFYLLIEGPYGLVNNRVDVRVKAGDIVIDAGSWIGDFAAYASAKGATTYAFEPTDDTFAILEKTAELNGNIIPVKKGLSDESTSAQLLHIAGNSGGNKIVTSSNAGNFSGTSSTVETTTIDDFVRENHLPRVDFIKADIEGFERHMLAGAQDTLARFAPKLALCTYHLPDDPQVMAELILKANPKYNIVQKRMKLFASVPE